MYLDKIGGLCPIGTLGAAVMTGTGVLAHRYVALMPIKVKRIMLKITAATVSSGNIVVAVKKRPTIGSASGEVAIGTITIPTAVAANAIYYKDVTGVVCAQGDEICFDVTTAAAGGGAAGTALPMIEAEEDPEVPANNSNMVASA
jgi:hypothetical protein